MLRNIGTFSHHQAVFIHGGIISVDISVSMCDFRNITDCLCLRPVGEIVSVATFGRNQVRIVKAIIFGHFANSGGTGINGAKTALLVIFRGHKNDVSVIVQASASKLTADKTVKPTAILARNFFMRLHLKYFWQRALSWGAAASDK